MNIQQIDLQAFVDNLEQAYTIVKQQIVICKAIKDLITNNNVVETDLTAMQTLVNDLDSQVNTIKINVTKLQNDMSETMIAVAQHTEKINQLTRVTPTDVIAIYQTDENDVPSFNIRLLHDGVVLSTKDIITQIKDLLYVNTPLDALNISTTFPSDFNNPTTCIALLDLSNSGNVRTLVTNYINNYYPIFSSTILFNIILDCSISDTTDRIIKFNKLPFTLSVMTINDDPIYSFKATSNINLDSYGWTSDHTAKFDFILEYDTHYNSIHLYVNLTTYAIL